MDTEQNIIEQCRHIIHQLIVMGTSIPTPLEYEESDWDFIKWCNKCAIESLDMAITHIEHMGDEDDKE
jgi:hypothetical protein